MAQHKWYNEIVAWASGAEIEIRFLNSKNIWGQWHSKRTPQWDTSERTEYRIKPQPKLVPFDFSDAEKLIGRIVKNKENGGYYCISYVSKSTVMGSSYETFLARFEFLDGSPCGKYVNE